MPNTSPFTIKIRPRETMTWKQFRKETPPNSIALDGMVRGGPNFDERTNHINFDHHEGVVREATMSTSMQVYFAIKGGLMKGLFAKRPDARIYINDTDQDTSLAVWLLLNYKKFELTNSIPAISRLLALTDRWDITGGSFPMSLDDTLIRQHAWVFAPYSDIRKSGALAEGSEGVLRSSLDAVLSRLDRFMMGEAEERELDTRHEILHDSPHFKIVDEIGGSEARYFLFSQGMNAFVSIVARRGDERMVCSIGRRSQYIPFPLKKLYSDLNASEGLESSEGWGGSTIVGGSPRQHGTGLEWTEIRDIVNERLRAEGIAA